MQFAASATLWQCAVLCISHITCTFHIPSDPYWRKKEKSSQSELKTNDGICVKPSSQGVMQLIILPNSQMDTVCGE